MQNIRRLNLHSYDSVAFDIEGTLADTVPAHHAARLAAFEEHGFGDVTAEHHALGATYGSHTFDIIGGILRATGHILGDTPFREDPLVQAVVDTKIKLFEEAASEGFAEIPGSIEFVNLIAPFYIGQMALVTSSEEHLILPFVENTGLTEHVPNHLLITHDTIEAEGLRGKPHEDPYLLAKKRLKTSHLLVFEDTVPGVESAKKAGSVVVGVCTNPANTAMFEDGDLEYPPDALVADYAEAAELFGL